MNVGACQMDDTGLGIAQSRAIRPDDSARSGKYGAVGLARSRISVGPTGAIEVDSHLARNLVAKPFVEAHLSGFRIYLHQEHLGSGGSGAGSEYDPSTSGLERNPMRPPWLIPFQPVQGNWVGRVGNIELDQGGPCGVCVGL